MFAEVERLLKEMNENVLNTNKILSKIEENLRVPHMVDWAKSKEYWKKVYDTKN